MKSEIKEKIIEHPLESVFGIESGTTIVEYQQAIPDVSVPMPDYDEKCGDISTTDRFIEKANMIHGGFYVYTKVFYVNAKTKICIICPTHGAFNQTPNSHLNGAGCKLCANERGTLRRSGDILTFKSKALIIHGDTYDYSLSVYVNNYTKLDIICNKHGIFHQTPKNHLRGQGCNNCKKLSLVDFVVKSNVIHNNKYDYSLVDLTNVTKLVTIKCPIHGNFSQTPQNHLYQQTGCPQCNNDLKRLTTSEFIEKAYLVHGHNYDYSSVQYKSAKSKIQILCPTHGAFFQTPSNHVALKQGCPYCHSQYSNKAIDWIETIMRQDKINIQHEHNGGEFHIPTTRYKADGYCKETNTIYEFYGDYWHGNPQKYTHGKKDQISIMKQRWKTTMDRETKIKQLGYNVVTIWESDFVL